MRAEMFVRLYYKKLYLPHALVGAMAQTGKQKGDDVV